MIYVIIMLNASELKSFHHTKVRFYFVQYITPMEKTPFSQIDYLPCFQMHLLLIKKSFFLVTSYCDFTPNVKSKEVRDLKFVTGMHQLTQKISLPTRVTKHILLIYFLHLILSFIVILVLFRHL